jgi:hypothetical protein
VKGCDEPDQPVAIHFEGDDGKPFKPCKTMPAGAGPLLGRRGNTFVGRRMTLYTDPNVLFGGIKVGGIRISHMSHIEREMAVALMAPAASAHPRRRARRPARLGSAPPAPARPTTPAAPSSGCWSARRASSSWTRSASGGACA